MNPLSASGMYWRTSLYGLFAVTVLNYLAQIPYYIHFYGIHHVAPLPLGLTLLGLTFAFFLAGFVLTLRNRRSGWWLLLGFLALEFAFYVVHDLSGAFLQDLPVVTRSSSSSHSSATSIQWPPLSISSCWSGHATMSSRPRPEHNTQSRCTAFLFLVSFLLKLKRTQRQTGCYAHG